jgi:SHS2 domain-containing protein
MGDFRFFDHAADVGMEIWGESPDDLFLTAGLGLMAWIGDPPSTRTVCQARVTVEAEDMDSLLVYWLQELLYKFYQEHLFLIGAPVIELDLDHFRVKAMLRGRVWKESLYLHYREIKAVTYHKLKIERDGAFWRATVILDV